MDAVIDIGGTLEWSFINSGDQAVTITAAANHTLVPAAIVLAAASSARLITTVTSTNTAITYRLA